LELRKKTSFCDYTKRTVGPLLGLLGYVMSLLAHEKPRRKVESFYFWPAAILAFGDPSIDRINEG
jgi:hypothetical protein